MKKLSKNKILNLYQTILDDKEADFKSIPDGQVKENIINEISSIEDIKSKIKIFDSPSNINGRQILGLYDLSDFEQFLNIKTNSLLPNSNVLTSLKTLDELVEKDKQREEDGFPRKIRLGKIVKPGQGKKEKVVIVPTTTEPKFYHDNSTTDEENENESESTGGSGEGEEGEVIGEQQAEPQPGEGEGQGAGEGNSANHDLSSEAYDLGKILTEKFQLPHLKSKGKKRSLTKFVYDLTDKNKRSGQILDKKATLKNIVKTNIILENINPNKPFNPENLFLNPQDEIYRILSKEKDFESQAVVFFLRDYSGSMQGKPAEVISTQHLFIYSFLMYQYKNNVKTRFILHDTEAKEVPDFYTYYKSNVAGGTNIFPAFDLTNKIIEEESLARDYNIYVFHGTDGDDWESDGAKTLAAINKLKTYSNRIGITVAKNSWSSSSSKTTIEKYLEKSNILENCKNEIKLDVFNAAEASEARIIEGIKKLMEE